MDLCTAKEIMIGDVISGPDGRSTVVGKRILPGANMLQFDFAEGRGNRCWSALLPNQKITRIEKTIFDMPLGFLIDCNNEVALSGIFEIVDRGKAIDVHYYNNTLDIQITTFQKKKVNRIMGQVTYTINLAR